MKKIVPFADFVKSYFGTHVNAHDINKLINSKAVIYTRRTKPVYTPDVKPSCIGRSVECVERATDEQGQLCVAIWWKAVFDDASIPDNSFYESAQDAQDAVLSAYYNDELWHESIGIHGCPNDLFGTPCSGRCDICPFKFYRK